MAHADPLTNLRSQVSRLFSLNPEMTRGEMLELFEVASTLQESAFDEFAREADRLLEQYLRAPVKCAEKRLFAEYFRYIHTSARLLSAKQEIPEESVSDENPVHSMALVDPKLYSSLGWCKVVSNADLPQSIVKAVDACRRRNDLVDSVLEPMFIVLQRISPARAVEWQLRYLETNKGSLDPDVARDLLRAWRMLDTLPSAVFEWMLKWSMDENLRRQWPSVADEADALLRHHSLRRWKPDRTNAESLLLLSIISQSSRNTARYHAWLHNSIAEMSASISFFVSLCRLDEQPTLTQWQQAAMMKEIQKVERLFPLILLLADLLLSSVDGAQKFAMALFGLSGPGKSAWEKQLVQLSERAVLLHFLRALRNNRPPMQVIESFSFGDPQIVHETAKELNLVTRQFDSLKQRDVVVKRLAVYYASYREPQLTANEIARRYRQLMRLVHEDNLRRVLTPDQFAEIAESNVLRELASVAADARKFLAMRRALELSLEEILAAEFDFCYRIRQRRHRFMRELLLSST